MAGSLMNGELEKIWKEMAGEFTKNVGRNLRRLCPHTHRTLPEHESKAMPLY
jgi:hypothetical protein